MLNGRLEVFQVDDNRALLEGEILLDEPYQMTTLELHIFNHQVYITPFDITMFRVIGDKLGVSFSVMVKMTTVNGILNEISIRN
jgi:hypothetical protein